MNPKTETAAEKMIPITKPFTGLEEWEALKGPFETGWLTQGPKVKEFERVFAERHRVRFAKATTSCTTALHLALVALGIKPGDEVIVPAFTWVATPNVVFYCGARPVFVDVSEESYNLDPRKLKAAITKKTRAIIPVHLFGLCADMDEIRNVLPKGQKIDLVEDAACAVGAAYKGTPAGGLGDAGCFSFHPRKVITTGEGGMLTTQDAELAVRVQVLRDHGADTSDETRHKGVKPYQMSDFNVLGYNYRMTDLQGAVGVVQMSRLDELVAERRRWARWYTEQLESVSWLIPPAVPDGYEHSWQTYVCRIDRTKIKTPTADIMEALLQKKISCRPGTLAVSELSYYKKELGLSAGQFPASKYLMDNTLAIPLFHGMTEEDYQRVVRAVKSLEVR